MNTITTNGIVLNRTDFGETDRIITVITPDQGKLRLIVKGVRRMKSKMAGGIELFSINQLTYIKGKGEIGTVISARSEKYFSKIVENIERVQLGYDLIKKLDKATEDNPEQDYFYLLIRSFEALNDKNIKTEIIENWFQAQILTIGGYKPNLTTDEQNQKLKINRLYNFDFENMVFTESKSGKYETDYIKIMRLLFGKYMPSKLNKIQGLDSQLKQNNNLIQILYKMYIRT